MKFRFLPLTLSGLLLVLLSGCLGLTLGTHSETETLPAVTIPGANLPANLDVALGLALSAPELDIGPESALVTFVSVRVLKLQILEASERDANEDGTPDSFDFVSGIDVFIRGDFEGTTRQLLIATLPENDPQVRSASRTLELTIADDNNDVFDFLLLPNGYDIVLDLKGTVPNDNVVISGEFAYRIGLGI